MSKKIINKIVKFFNKNSWLLFLILSLPAVRYLFIKGFFGVSDDLHVGWLFEMSRAVRTLQFPPRYVPDLSFGFGYPLFTFVYPLPFYIAEIFNFVGFSLVDSLKLVFGLSIPVSMHFMYKFLRVYMPKSLSLAGAILYVYTPYRAVELFVRGSVGEIVAFVFFPLILYSVVKGKYILLALSTAALIMSHNILSYMFFPFVVLLIILQRKNFLANLKGLFLGLLASIYFWFPAIFESKLFKYSTVFNFYDHFPTLKQLITPYFGYGASVAGPYDTMSFYLGITGIVVVVLGVLSLLFKFKKIKTDDKTILVWATLVYGLSIFMMNYRSAFLWENLPFLPYFQFPWRFLALITLVSPIFLVGIYSFIKNKDKKLLVGVSFLVALFALISNFNYFKYSEFLGREDKYYINRYIPLGSASAEYNQTGEEYLRLPKDNIKRPEKVYPRAYTDFNADIEVEEINALDAKITTSSDNDFLLNYNKYYYPGWRVLIDGQKVNIIPGKPFGQISFMVPEGKHQVLVEYKESQTRLIFDIISLIAFGAIITVLVKNKK